jgi:hypothetical protein
MLLAVGTINFGQSRSFDRWHKTASMTRTGMKLPCDDA